MAERSISVALNARVSGFVSGIRTAQANMHAFNDELEKSWKKRRALSDIGNVAGKIGIAAAAGFVVAATAAAKFDKSMSIVASTGQDARDNLEALRKAAIDAGAATQFSATEAADGITALAKAGVSAKDTLGGGLKGALDLAAAGEVSVGAAAETAASAMTQFKLAGKDVPHIADLLAAGAGKAQGEVSDLAMALNQSGLVASQTGLSIEETTGALASFASAGLLGSDAGTSFKTMLLSLNGKSEKAKKLMDALGISAYDASGNFVGLSTFAGRLQDGLKDLSAEQRNAALQTIFGTDAIRAANILYNQGAEGIEDWIAKVDDSGFAAETARIKMDNLAGDIEKLRGSLETFLIGAGEGAQGPLRQLTQAAEDVVNVLNEIPAPLKNAATGMLAITAVVGGGLWFTSRVVTNIANTKDRLRELGIQLGVTKEQAEGAAASTGRLRNRLLLAGTAAGGFALASTGVADKVGLSHTAMLGTAGLMAGPWGGAIGVGTGLLLDFAKRQHNATVTTEDLTGALDAQTGALTDLGRQQITSALQSRGVFEAAKQLGVALGDVQLAAEGDADALARVNAAMDGLADTRGVKGAFAHFFDFDTRLPDEATAAAERAAATLREGLESTTTALGDQRTALENSRTVTEQVAGSTGDLAGAHHEAAEAADDQAASVDNLKRAVSELEGLLDKRGAVNAYAQAFRDLQQSVKDSGADFRVTTEAGLKNRAAMDGVAKAAEDLSQKVSPLERQRVLREAVADLRGFRDDSDSAKRYVQPLIDKLRELERTDPDIAVAINAKQIIEEARSLQAQIDSLHGKDLVLFLQVRAGDTSLERHGVDGERAAGGPVAARRTYLVGERGPELLVMGDQSGRVLPNVHARQMLSEGRPGRRMSGGAARASDPMLRNAVRELTQTVATLEGRLARLGDDVARGAADGSYRGTGDRMRAMNVQPYLTSGGF